MEVSAGYDDDAVYAARKRERGRTNKRIIRRSGSLGMGEVKSKSMQQDASEPELAHPGEEGGLSAGMTNGMAKTALIRNIGKQVFMEVVRETVELVALEAASKALHEETNLRPSSARKVPGRRGKGTPSSDSDAHSMATSSSSVSSPSPLTSLERKNKYKNNNKTTEPILMANMRSNASSSTTSTDDERPGELPGRPLFTPESGSDAFQSSSKNGASPSYPRGQVLKSWSFAEAGPPGGARASWGRFRPSVGMGAVGIARKGWGYGSQLSADSADALRRDFASRGRESNSSFREPGGVMEDKEREVLLGLLGGAYEQVNALTDELQVALRKQNQAEMEVHRMQSFLPKSKNQRKQSNSGGFLASIRDFFSTEEERSHGSKPPRSKRRSQRHSGLSTSSGESDSSLDNPMARGVGVLSANQAASTMAKLREEVESLNRRVVEGKEKEEKQRSELARLQRKLGAIEEQSQYGDGMDEFETPSRMNSRTCMTPGGTRYKGQHARPLVDRIADLEEKLVGSNMANAIAKQDYLTVKLEKTKLEKESEMLRHKYARLEAMNVLLQTEIDRLQRLSPEAEGGTGWRRWLAGSSSQSGSPEQGPMKVEGDGAEDTPVVVVRDLDNNQLVYAHGRH